MEIRLGGMKMDVDCMGSVVMRLDPHHKGYFADHIVKYSEQPKDSVPVGLCHECYKADKLLIWEVIGD